MNPKDYYDKNYIRREMANLLRFRELAFAFKIDDKWAMTRNWVGYNEELLLAQLKRNHYETQPLRIYQSVAQIANEDGKLPWRNFNMSDKQAQKDHKEEFNRIYEVGLIGYDLFMDFDSEEPDMKDAYEDVKRLKEELDLRHIPYTLVFSGSKGFHLSISDANMPKWLSSEKVEKTNDFRKTLTDIYNLETSDPSVKDVKRLRKLPYSIDGKSGKVVLPLNDWQFEHFFELDLSPEGVINSRNNLNTHSQIHLAGRGLLERTGKPSSVERFYRFIMGDE